MLRGARGLLAHHRPLVVFESWPVSTDRSAIYALLEEADYEIQALASPFREAPGGGSDAFLASAATNFLARPRRA